MLTSRPAEVFGIRDRGRLTAGLAADVTIFDPATVGAIAEGLGLVDELGAVADEIFNEARGGIDDAADIVFLVFDFFEFFRFDRFLGRGPQAWAAAREWLTMVAVYTSLFIVGAIWSALHAWLMSDDADARAAIDDRLGQHAITAADVEDMLARLRVEKVHRRRAQLGHKAPHAGVVRRVPLAGRGASRAQSVFTHSL